MLLRFCQRFLAVVPVMFIVAFLIFSLLFLTPGDPASVLAGDQATAADIERIREALGLDRPFLIQFGDWLWRVIHADLGRSILNNIPVSTLIAQRLAPTLSLLLVTIVTAVTVAVPLGVIAAWKVGKATDRLIMIFTVLGFSVPVFVFGYLIAYVFGVRLDWLPVQGYTPLSYGFFPWLANLILPGASIAFGYVALIARVTRASVLEVLKQDYIRTARAKGVGTRDILFVHALKNAGIPVVTVIGLGASLLVGGAVVTETVFAIPGLGRLTVDAILRRDYPVIQGVVLFFSFSYVLINLLVDLSYSFLDPQVEY